jgi:hypothetical protein
MKNLLLCSSALFLILVGCSPTHSSTPVEISGVTQVPAEPTPTPVTVVSDLVPVTTYTDSNLRYAFDYPVELTGPRSQGEGLPEGGEKMDILPQADYGAEFEQALPWFREGNADHEFTEEAVALPTGASGILIRFTPVTGEPIVHCLLTAVSETTILLCGAGWELQYFAPIAFSLRPTE